MSATVPGQSYPAYPNQQVLVQVKFVLLVAWLAYIFSVTSDVSSPKIHQKFARCLPYVFSGPLPI